MKRILIIDDDASLRGVLNLALTAEGYEVIEADNGTEGHRLARSHLPDLIFCDMVMPGMNGKRVVEQLRTDALTARQQVVLMTGDEQAASQRQSMDFGADDYLKKPFNIDELLRCARARLRRAELQGKVGAKIVDDLRQSLDSNLPHELFTPIAGILGLTDLMRESVATASEKEMHDMFNSVDQFARRLHRTLRNYLALMELHAETSANARAGRTSADYVQQVVNDAAKIAVERHNRSADLRVGVFDFDIPMAPADLATVVEELVDNASTFSIHGMPIQVDPIHANSLVGLCVGDTGRGMTRQQVESIGAFKQFESHNYARQGLGLGLALVKLIAQTYGGRLEIESEAGVGTRCSVLLH
jgi:DNA-binding response OmpR family regulator